MNLKRKNMATITLTEAQLAQIKQDMEIKEEMLTDGEINDLANKLNGKVDIPFLKDEEKEYRVLFKIIRFIDRTLYKLLPNEYYKMVKNTTDGISKEEAKELEGRLTPLINNLVNIPILTEDQEAKLIGLVLNLIINAMVKGFKLEESPIV